MKDYQLSEKIIDNTTHYYATFISPENEEITEEIDKSVYDIIDESQKSMSSQARTDRRYGVCSFDESIGEQEIDNEEEMTEFLLSAVYENIDELSDVQKRRINSYFFKGMTYKEIAEAEHICFSTIRESIQSAVLIIKAKKYL